MLVAGGGFSCGADATTGCVDTIGLEGTSSLGTDDAPLCDDLVAMVALADVVAGGLEMATIFAGLPEAVVGVEGSAEEWDGLGLVSVTFWTTAGFFAGVVGGTAGVSSSFD